MLYPARCTYCGSDDMVWDFSTGSVICSACASVVDSIYIAYMLQPAGGSSASRRIWGRRVHGLRAPRARSRRIHARRCRAPARKVSSLRVVESLPAEVRAVCELGIAIARRISPALVEGKTLRSRYAVGYTVARLAKGVKVRPQELVKTFKISHTTALRLIRSVETRLARR